MTVQSRGDGPAIPPAPPADGKTALTRGDDGGKTRTLSRPGSTAPSSAGLRGRPGRLLVAGLLLPAATVAVIVASLQAGSGPLPAVQAVACGLVLVAAACGAVGARAAERTPQWQVALGSLAGAIALAAARIAGPASGGERTLARAVVTVAVLLVIAISFHLMLALPDGRLGSRARRAAAGAGYAVAGGAGLALAAARHPLPAAAVVLAWGLAVACALPAARLRYLAAAGRDRERMQWIATGTVVAADAALVVTVLHLLVLWPAQVAAVAAGCAVFLPLGMLAGGLRGLGPYGGRVLVQVASAVGFTVVVAAIYLVIVLGIGTAPRNAADHNLLGLSMLAAAVAAVGYLPARGRLAVAATRLVYGSREAPDEALRTFGSRLTRAIPLEELLLQLAESLRTTLSLTSAEVYTGAGEVLERVAAVPDTGSRSLIVTPRERPVVTRAGISGSAWASVWLPALLDGRDGAQLRVAPVSHGGELLGLIVVERPANGDAFTEDDDRVLTELARQVGLALHNARLDTELQTTLDELRRQAQELRESRARIVASGDAERRRVERNLHDGAQQSLVALAVTLRLARDTLADDPDGAAELLDQLAGDLRATIQELRDLAHGIYPPLLADSGLEQALRAAAGRSPLQVSVQAAGVSRYPPEVEAAVYFCCLEALQNAAKHAPAATVQVRVWEESGGLRFSVTDDGPGLDAAAAGRGHGFTNMADRLGAIGGTIRWQSEPGHGTQVQGSIPLV
jgi:signal transduction histidine kinase